MGIEITKDHLNALQDYLEGKMTADDAIEKAGLKISKANFFKLMKDAYKNKYLILHAPDEPNTVKEFREWYKGHYKLEQYITRGNPNDKSFYMSAAEEFLKYLRNLLVDTSKDTISIGIVSGSSTASLVDNLVESGLWEEIIGGHIIGAKRINVVALNATPVYEWELAGNANISTLRLSLMLQEKLKTKDCEVMPFGISSDLVIRHAELEKIDKSTANRRVLEIAEPTRLKVQSPSRLNIVITGVGTPEDSVFRQVLESEQIPLPAGMVGDVAYWPVDEKGNELELRKKEKGISVRVIIYSAINLKTMKKLVTEANCTLMLIARNSRRGKEVDKTKAIRAAIYGNSANFIFTDQHTAEEIIKVPY